MCVCVCVCDMNYLTDVFWPLSNITLDFARDIIMFIVFAVSHPVVPPHLRAVPTVLICVCVYLPCFSFCPRSYDLLTRPVQKL